MVAGVLTAGLSISQIAYASPLSALIQVAADPRADVTIDSKIMVERTEVSENGETKMTLVDPATVKVTPGDKLLFINVYRNNGAKAVTGFVVNNPVHSAVSLIEVVEDWALVSVDDGKNFAKLADLTVTETGGNAVSDGSGDSSGSGRRAAEASDVTHIRWVLASPIAPGASGELRFRGVVK